MFQKHRLGLAALACVAMAAAGDAGSDTSGTGTGAPPPGEPPTPTPPPAPTKAAKLTSVRVLADCAYGKANDIAQLAGDDLKNAIAQGNVDDDKDAVAYAKSLPQNQAKPAKAG
jgi:hypothetical protein